MMKRTLAMILALLSISTLCACAASDSGSESSDTTSADTTSTVESETTVDELGPDLPEMDYEGEKFTIISMEDVSYEIYAEEQTGDIIVDAVFERNRAIEERYNIEIENVLKDGWASESEVTSTLQSSIMSGEDEFDLALGYQAYVVPLAMDGLFNNILDVPYIDVTKPWWSQKCVEILTLDDCLYMLTGDISHTLWRNLYVLFFNKMIAEQYDIGNLYEMVSSGDWLYEDFVSISKSISSDVNGDGQYTEEDMYGLVTCLHNHIRQFMVSLDTPITTPDDEGYPTLTFNNPKSIDVLEKINSLYWDTSTFHSSELQEPSASAIPNVFTADHALFNSAFLGNAELLRNMDTDFGIIPYPKYNEQQDGYYTGVHNSVSTVIIPITVKDVERAGIITEALCYEGYSQIVPEYYEVVLKTKYARDNESQEMLNIIREGISFNFGWVHSIPMDSIGGFYSALVQRNSTDFVSEYASKEETYLTALDDIVEKYKEAKK